MVGCHCLSLACIMDKEIPPPAIFAALSKKWVHGVGDNEAYETAIHPSRTSVNPAVGAPDETGQAPHEFLHTLMGRHSKEVDQITFLAVDEDGLVYLLHSLFYVTGGK